MLCSSIPQSGAVCPQDAAHYVRLPLPVEIPKNQSEDCLFLNIWTPALDANAKLPVMFWIHGGSFVFGKCTLSGRKSARFLKHLSFFCKWCIVHFNIFFFCCFCFPGFSNMFSGTGLCSLHNVIFVSINYRLGPFGENVVFIYLFCFSFPFLCLPLAHALWYQPLFENITMTTHLCIPRLPNNCRWSCTRKLWFNGSNGSPALGAEVHWSLWWWSRERDCLR